MSPTGETVAHFWIRGQIHQSDIIYGPDYWFDIMHVEDDLSDIIVYIRVILLFWKTIDLILF